MIVIATILSVPVGFIVGVILFVFLDEGALGSLAVLGCSTAFPAATFYYYKNKRYTKKCYFCAETIKEKAILCIHCGKEQPKKAETETFDDKLKYLFLVIILVVILLFVLGNILDLIG